MSISVVVDTVSRSHTYRLRKVKQVTLKAFLTASADDSDNSMEKLRRKEKKKQPHHPVDRNDS